jgi:hypothetical protein
MKALAGSDIAAHLARRGLPSTPNVAAAYFVGVAQKCTASFPRVLPGHHTSTAPAVKEALEHADRAWAWLETARQVGQQEFVDAFLKHAAACTARLEAAVSFAVAHPGSAGPAFSGTAAWKVFHSVAAPHAPLPSAVGAWTSERAMAEGFALLFAGKSAGTDEVDSPPAAEPPPAIVPSEVAMAIAAFGRGKASDPDGLDAETL